MVVHGLDGQDEVSVTGPTRIVSLERGEIREFLFDPGQVGLEPYALEELQVGSAEDNAAIARALIAGGTERPAIRNAVLLNAGAALAVFGLAGGIEEGYRQARAALESGAVKEKLEQIVTSSRELAAGTGTPRAAVGGATR